MSLLASRLVWTLLIILLAWQGYRLANRLILRRARASAPGLEHFRPGIPGILYFTAPGCLPCKTAQQPALLKLQEFLDDQIQVVQVDASVYPELADHWGVLTVPTTFIIDAAGRPRRVNHGVAVADKLMHQLAEAEGREFTTSRIESGSTPASSPGLIMYNRTKEVS